MLKALCIAASAWLVMSGTAHAATACPTWGDVLQLGGQLSLRTHAGPPNYDSVHRGDAREVVPVFKLQHKLCVQGGGERHQVAQVQLLDLSQALRGERLARCLKHCSLSGALQQAESDHHHLPVLLELADEPDERPAPSAHHAHRRR
jgi:hypothetical protein